MSVFVALAVTGFLIWELQPTRYVFEAVGLDYANPDFFCLRLLSEPLLRCVLALAAGLFFPRGFYLWGLALAIHTPLTHALPDNRMREAGLDPYLENTVDILGYLLLEATLTVAMIAVYTCFAGFGMLARYLMNRRCSVPDTAPRG